MDVASLGLEVDSAPVEKGARALDKLSTSANKAEGQTKRLSGAAGAAETALEGEAAAASKAAAALRAHSRVANDNAVVMRKSFQASNLAAQGFDIAVTSAMGMNAAMIGLQQGTQVAQVLASTDKPLRSLAGAFAAILSPTTFLTIALVSLSAAALQLVNWGKAAGAVMDSIASILPSIAMEATIAGAALALAFSPAIIRAVLALAAALSGALVGALRAVSAAALANPFAVFALAITAAVTAAYVFRDEVKNAIGVDVIGIIANAANVIVGSFVGAYNAIKLTWSALPAALGDVTIQTANAVIGGMENMINYAIDRMNAFIGRINQMMLEVSAITGIDLTIDGIGDVNFGRIENRFANQASSVGSSISEAFSSAMQTDYVGKLGDVISSTASKASAKLKELAESVRKIGDEEDKAAAKAAKRYAKIVESARSRIASSKAEREGLFLTNEAALRLRYTVDLLNQAREAGIKLSSAQATELRGLASEMAAAEINVKRTAEAIDLYKTSTKTFITDFRTSLMQGKGLWESFASAALNALDRIINKLETQFVDALFSSFGNAGATGGGGGLMGGVFGLLGSFLGFAKGAAFSGGNVIPFATGGVVDRATTFAMSGGRTGLMGEAGPEAIMPLRRGRDGKLGVSAMNDNARNLNIRIGVDVDNNGSFYGYVKSISEETVSESAGEIVDASVSASRKHTSKDVAKLNRHSTSKVFR